ncbi:MAG TPA: C39 family peptidase [Candidatus Dormibacteraeota bacterium]|nr:C39 family peptidase [Candidatus Dormibacteraeota bacterium]
MRALAVLAMVFVLSGCGAAPSGSPLPAATPTPSMPSAAALTALADQVFPLNTTFGYYVECINLKENGAARPGGNDYSGCPITDALRARMVATQAHFCPCEQNPSVDRAINVTPVAGGGIASVRLYHGNVHAELVILSVNGRLLVDDLPAKGDAENGTSTPITFQDKPSSTASPTAQPSVLPGSRVLIVPWYHQAFALSCESASLRMALAYQGIATTDAAVLNIIGSDLRPPTFDNAGMHWGDPFATFVGNVSGSEIALTGYGTYYPTIARAAGVLGGRVLRAGQGIPPADVYAAVLTGHPVVTWVTYKWVIQHRRDYTAFDGRKVAYAGPGEHAVVVVGVTPTRVLINNPESGPEWISKSTFEPVYATYDDMSVILA